METMVFSTCAFQGRLYGYLVSTLRVKARSRISGFGWGFSVLILLFSV